MLRPSEDHAERDSVEDIQDRRGAGVVVPHRDQLLPHHRLPSDDLYGGPVSEEITELTPEMTGRYMLRTNRDVDYLVDLDEKTITRLAASDDAPFLDASLCGVPLTFAPKRAWPKVGGDRCMLSRVHPDHGTFNMLTVTGIKKLPKRLR